MLRNPELDPQTKAGLVGELLGEADELVRNFVRLAAEKGRIGDIEEIARAFDRLMAAEERRIDVELTTAFELSELGSRGDSQTDSRSVGPRGRSDAEGRSLADRRFRPAGRLNARRRIRARPDRGLAP